MFAVRFLVSSLVVVLASSCAGLKPVEVSSLADVDKSAYGPRQVERFEKAKADYQAVLAKKTPTYAQMGGALFDGGTTGYEGDGYTLVIWSRLQGREDGLWVKTGPSITLHRQITGGREIECSDLSLIKPTTRPSE
ncbi:hypothetical protein [Sulfuriroseicoccus oceanibius]|uniref:Lipoprotein n=1 Tax=Sulfuriroseicoccus oceanibius TaxID=2707525 RepID=A0A6B3L9Z0_9BACT|nr:hypothetical protein [Sulfuriroseicoccus oceanibius]QQL44717.1 hypothetical protein G3M56_012665 [Sulfuriroseicoccus oceanibius]